MSTPAVGILVIGAMAGDARQRAEKKQIKKRAKQPYTIRRVPNGSAWYSYDKSEKTKKGKQDDPVRTALFKAFARCFV